MRIGLDVMGGDFAPEATVEGALLAFGILPEDVHIVLIGNEKLIRERLAGKDYPTERLEIVHASQVIEMGERPLKAISTKHDSSISVGLRMMKNGQLDAFSSAGNSGALLAGSMFTIGVIPGVIRPATFAYVPQENGAYSIILDIGTNTDVKVDVLYQFALLGSIYAESVMNIQNPRVGLLNIGEEEGKGNLLTLSAYDIMKESRDFNFIGNVETRDLFKSKADVIVCDGFTGNVLIKMVEAIFRILQKRSLLDDYLQRFNYELYGGSPILGVNGHVVLGHGISSPTAIKNMLRLSHEVTTARLAEKIRDALINYIN